MVDGHNGEPGGKGAGVPALELAELPEVMVQEGQKHPAPDILCVLVIIGKGCGPEGPVDCAQTSQEYTDEQLPCVVVLSGKAAREKIGILMTV
jgi:hypothetical protein